MREIQLGRVWGRKNLVALVSDADYELVSQFNWSALPHRKTVYAHRTKGEDGHGQYMHRLILGLTDPRISTDHINGNGLDNRRENLRVVSESVNQFNRPKRGLRKDKEPTSRFKGVRKVHRRWQAQTQLHGFQYKLGSFATEEEAARAYDEKVLELIGEQALVGCALNFPMDELCQV